MENYLLCGEIGGSLDPPLPPSSQSSTSDSSGVASGAQGLNGRCVLYKGRRKGSVNFVGIWRHDKTTKELVANGVCIMHSLDHSNVLKFLEWYETPKHIWVITELATGGSLADILEQDGSIPPPYLNDFVSDVVKGLYYLHSRNILYCDLQPRKILLDNRETLKLSDFTLAQSLEDSVEDRVKYDFTRSAQAAFGEGSSRSKTEQRKGGVAVIDTVPSPFYAAPELYEDGGRFDKATDLWSLGVLTYELCTGRQPFHGRNSEELQFMICHGSADMELISSAAHQEATKVTQIISQLLQKSSKSRSWEDLIQRRLFLPEDIL